MPNTYRDDPLPWQTLGSKYLFRRPWLTLREDRVRLPGGGQIDAFYVWEFPTWVNVVAVTRDGELVLIRQYRHGIGRVHFEIPAGVCDPSDESPLQAARRELQEETGFAGGDWQEWMAISANPALQTNLTYTFLATGVECREPQRLEATEELTVHLVSVEEARKIVLGGGMVQALHVAPLLKYFLATSIPAVPGCHP